MGAGETAEPVRGVLSKGGGVNVLGERDIGEERDRDRELVGGVAGAGVEEHVVLVSDREQVEDLLVERDAKSLEGDAD